MARTLTVKCFVFSAAITQVGRHVNVGQRGAQTQPGSLIDSDTHIY